MMNQARRPNAQYFCDRCRDEGCEECPHCFLKGCSTRIANNTYCNDAVHDEAGNEFWCHADHLELWARENENIVEATEAVTRVWYWAQNRRGLMTDPMTRARLARLLGELLVECAEFLEGAVEAGQ